jgi:hypothetical protein
MNKECFKWWILSFPFLKLFLVMTPDIIFLHYSNISEAEKKTHITCPSGKEEFSSPVIKNFAFVNRKKR